MNITMAWSWVDGLIGIIGSAVIVSIAYRRKSLSPSGSVAAFMMGTLMYTFGQLAWFGTLLVFFLSSSLLSKLKHQRKQLAEHSYAKGHQRDAGQVLANGGVALGACLAHAMSSDPLWWWIFLGAMATVNADTWATEIGSMSKSQPRSILTGKRVTAGTSGGISLLGTLATMSGGLTIGTFAWIFLQFGDASQFLPEDRVQYILPLLFICGIAGTFGSLADSWLGAKWQVMYRCQECDKEIEKPVHCAQPASHVRGFLWMNNDTVNFLSSVIGSLVALVLFYLISFF